jgi:hypothetical protein
MKTLLTAITISIGFVVASIGGTPSFGIVDASISGSTNQPADIGPKMSMRSYKITPDTFYSSLKRKIVPKDGESDIKLLQRYFQEHHIDLTKPKAAVFLNEKLGKLFVRVTPADQDKVERLVVRIANTK